MKTKFKLIRRSVTILLPLLACTVQSYGQTAPPADETASTAPKPGEIVELPRFEVVSGRDDSSFYGKEALSLTRTGVQISDISQSVVVVNQAYLNAIKPALLAEMVSYVGGGQIGNINWALDRFMIRGFTSQGDFVDGFLNGPGGNAPTTNMNYIDQMEIVKGPAAVMSTNATGVIGGAINKVLKRPTANQVNSLTVEYGRYDAARAILDVGGAITKDSKLLWRLLALGQDQKSYYDYTYDKRLSIMPMLSYSFSKDTEAWVKAEKLSFHFSSYNGIPLDGRTNLPIAVSPTTNFGEDTPQNWRVTNMWRVWGQFTTRPNDHLAIRFAAIDSSVTYWRTESVLSPSGTLTPTRQADGSYAYVPFVQYTIPPNYVSGQRINRATTADTGTFPRREFQNDYAFNFNTGKVSHKLLLGAAISDFPNYTKGWSSGGSSLASSTSVDPFNLVHPVTVGVRYDLPPTSFQDTSQTYAKMFALENASFLNDRLLLNYGVSRHRFELSQATYPYNQVTGVYGTPTYVPSTLLYKNIVQYGVVVKPVKNISVFYGRNANFSASPIQNGVFLPPQQGTQRETGIKADLIPGRVNISVSYFELFQINNSLPAFPQTVPPTQVLTPGETSRGFDGDFNITLTKNIDLVGSFALFKAHVQVGAPWSLAPMPYDGQIHATIPVSDVSQKNFAVWGRYAFHTGALKGLSFGVGLNSITKRAITDTSNQVWYGYIPGYDLVNVNAVYETKHYKLQVNVDNVFNSTYWYGARSNQVLVPSSGINPRVSVTYKF